METMQQRIAIIKAKAYAEVCDFPVFAMDDNLYIEGIPLGMQPGMFVRRVNGKRLSDDEMIKSQSYRAQVYGDEGKLTGRWVYGMAVINEGRFSTYTWNKDDFYIVSKPSDKIKPGYPLDTISVDKRLNKYFTDITSLDKEKILNDESDVIDFLCENLQVLGYL